MEWRCYAISIFWKFTIGSNCYYFKLAAITPTDFTHGARLSKYSLGNVCMCVCLRLCFVDGSRCARKTLRCGQVLDVAQRSNGSEIVHHHTDRLYSRSSVIEILARKCVYVCVCVSSIMLCRWFKVCSQNVAVWTGARRGPENHRIRESSYVFEQRGS